MKKMISRRDFLKLSSSFLLSQALSHIVAGERQYRSNKENVLILVFDALSTSDVSIYGYPRDTMPNLTRIIERATVFHNHYSNGNFTTPGTASLLTGTLPWTHRAFQSYDSVREDLESNNIFYLFHHNGYHNLAYSHNPLVERLLIQFKDFLEYHIPRQELFLSEDIYNQLFKNDYDTAELSRYQILEDVDIYSETYRLSHSLFFQEIYQKITSGFHRETAEQFSNLFPRGLPKLWKDDYYTLEDGIDRLIHELTNFPTPFMGYFHFLPPHYPYNPRKEFSELFWDDGYNMQKKPDHLFSLPQTYKESLRNRLFYDQHIAYVDAEFARLYKYMDEKGLLDDTWLVLTSDHGEMFERGIIGHRTECLHDPVIRVPLVIFEPQQTTRRDVFTYTSNIDVLPTLLHLTGQQIPDWVEGVILPPYSDPQIKMDPRVFSVHSLHAEKFAPLTTASVMMVKDQYKLHAYFGYEKIPSGETLYELYNLENDPEELDNLISTKTKLARNLQDELQMKLLEVNKPFIS